MQTPALIRPLPPAARLCLLWLLVAAALALPLSTRAEAPVEAADATLANGTLDRLALAPWTLTLHEPAGVRGLEDLPNLDQWAPAKPGTDLKLGGIFGFDARPHWLRVELRNGSDRVLPRVLVLHNVLTSKLSVYAEVPGSARRVFHTGATLAPETRPLASRYYAFPVKLAPRSTQVWWLRVESQKSMTLPLYLWQPEALEQSEAEDLLLYGGAFGAVMGLLLYNVILLAVLRQRNYFWYVLYGFFGLGASIVVSGYHLLLPGGPLAPLSDPLDGFMLALSGAALVQFMFGLFDIRSNLPRQVIPLRCLQAFWGMSALAFLWRPGAVSDVITLPSSLALGYVYFVVILAVKRRLPGAWPLLTGLTVLFAGATCLLQYYAGNLAWSRAVAFAHPLGTALEMVLAALSLAAVFNRERDQAAKARLGAEIEKVSILQASEQQLEQRVAERTGFLHTVLKELVDAKEVAETASATKDQLMANMSHELRTPINSITGTTFLLTQSGLNDLQQQYVSRIQTASKNLLRLVNRVLDLSALTEHRSTLTTLEFSLRELLHKLHLDLRKKAAAKQLAFRLVVDDALPDSLSGDPGRLLQLIDNYADNAIKFTEQGSVTVALELREQERSALLIYCAVTDTGIGLTEAQCAALFQSFHQIDGSKTRAYGGLGLGLALNQRIAELMQGEVGVSSQPGSGSTFWFTARMALGRRAAGSDVGDLPPAHLEAAGGMRDASGFPVDDPSKPAPARDLAGGLDAFCWRLEQLLEEGDAEAVQLVNANLDALTASVGPAAAGEVARAVGDWNFDKAIATLRAALAVREG